MRVPQTTIGRSDRSGIFGSWAGRDIAMFLGASSAKRRRSGASRQPLRTADCVPSYRAVAQSAGRREWRSIVIDPYDPRPRTLAHPTNPPVERLLVKEFRGLPSPCSPLRSRHTSCADPKILSHSLASQPCQLILLFRIRSAVFPFRPVLQSSSTRLALRLT